MAGRWSAAPSRARSTTPPRSSSTHASSRLVGPQSDVFGFGRTCLFALFGMTRPRSKLIRALPDPWPDLLDDCCDERIEDRPADFAAVLERLKPASPCEQAEEKPQPKARPAATGQPAPAPREEANQFDRYDPGAHRARGVLDGLNQGTDRSAHATFSRSKREWLEAEHPQHRVDITRPYLLGIHQVTVGQFRHFVEASRHQTEAERDGKGSNAWDDKKKAWGLDPAKNWRNPGFSQADDHPVVCVSHNDAVAFCQWLSTKEKREGRTYCLPTEAEWKYACRAGTNALFVISDELEDLVKIANVADASTKQKFPDWKCVKGNDGFVYTAPVGSFAPNSWGLYDMIGNVWEWCADWYDEKYYATSPTANPPGAAEASSRVIRGGSWSNYARRCRPAYRFWNTPEYRDYNLGFRVAAVQE